MLIYDSDRDVGNIVCVYIKGKSIDYRQYSWLNRDQVHQGRNYIMLLMTRIGSLIYAINLNSPVYER